ncbi:MAG: alanyl-tRNA synthetase [Gammaproteobacteria bacterium]|jgi:alanyl-tRNA synthetase
MTSNEVRAAFLEYFRDKGHEIVSGSPLIPANDPTLLFTNAGMVQFKELFLGNEVRSYTRATTAQRCIRAGGKHNDLDNVGYTARHHTFFEMLGNFSFGDYFKRDAINFAWEFLTVVLEIPEQRLWITVFDDDDEAADIWLKEIGVSEKRFSRCGESDNFWAMGDTGPCGPCSEIFYDHGEDIPGGPPGSADADGDRYVEIWNLVFTQYDRASDGTLTPIPKPSVDTGMGLERIAAIKQGVHNNYDIDTFQKLIKAIENISESKHDQIQVSHRVIADHIRSCAFLIADGVIPSNEGRGYVLRRIIRRAIRHGNKIGFDTPFFHKLVAPLVEIMGESSEILNERKKFVERLCCRKNNVLPRPWSKD